MRRSSSNVDPQEKGLNIDQFPISMSGRQLLSRTASKGTLPLLGLALAMSGCAVGPDFLAPEASVQDNWIENGR